MSKKKGLFEKNTMSLSRKSLERARNKIGSRTGSRLDKNTDYRDVIRDEHWEPEGYVPFGVENQAARDIRNAYGTTDRYSSRYADDDYAAGRRQSGRKSSRRRSSRDDTFSMGDMKFELSPTGPVPTEPVNSDNRKRLLFGFAILLVLMSLLCIRMGYWQIIKSDDLRTMAASMQTVDTEIDAVRGTIYDSRMSTLAETVTEYQLYIYSQGLYKSNSVTNADREKIVEKMSQITGVKKETVKKKLEGKDNLVLIADGQNKTQIDKAEKAFPGMTYVKTHVSRYYPNGAFASQLIGSVNTENTGRSGLEYEYNSVLAGVKGRTVKKTDRDGNTLANGSSKYYDAQDGYSIVTSVDSVIQHYVEDAVQTGMRKTGASAITVVVMNPKTGEVLAMAQTPEYDPNNANQPVGDSAKAAFKKLSEKEQSEYLSKMWTIEAVSSIYEPGSTFKLISAASSLETGHTTSGSRYYCGGGINVNGTRLNCLGSHGSQDIKVAVGNSCNSGLAKVALDMGSGTFYNYIELFGFRDRTGIDLPGETYSIVKNPDGMGAVDLATTGFGQGIAITPIQVLSAVNCFGNGGYLIKPTVVSKIIDKNGDTVEEIKPTKVRQVVSEETADEMREIMEYYVSDAGGDKAYVPGYRIGGKTGTANIASGGGYSSSTDCSFVAMAPMDDPQISMLVIVHKPTKTQYGNNSAGPIVKEIMTKSLKYLGVERQYTPSEAKKAKSGKVTVPKVSGKDSKKAIAALKKAKLKYKVEPESSSSKSFVVVDQYPKAGSKVAKGTTVYLYSE